MRLLSGLIADTLRALFGGGRNVVAETVEVFRENAEGAALRSEARHAAAMAQFAAEFSRDRRSWFDRLMDGMNRLPRPLLALSTLGLLAAAMVDPLWFAARMRGLALVPEPLWWLLGVVVSFYFGARQQVNTRAFSAILPRNWHRPAAWQAISPRSTPFAQPRKTQQRRRRRRRR